MQITVFGGCGFVGSYVTEKLKNEDHKVITSDLNRGGENHRQADITKQEQVKQATKGSNLVINLVGLSPLSEPQNTTYKKVHVGGAKSISYLDKPVIHISALGADPNSEVPYLKTKGQAENVIKENIKDYSILRPSIMFGKGSELFDLVKLAEKFRAFPLITAKVQPIFVGDVVKIINLLIKNEIDKKILELGGDKQMTIYKMVEKIFKADGKACFPIPFAKTGAKLTAWFDILNLTGITQNQVKFLNKDNILEENDAKKFIEITNFSKWLDKDY